MGTDDAPIAEGKCAPRRLTYAQGCDDFRFTVSSRQGLFQRGDREEEI